MKQRLTIWLAAAFLIAVLLAVAGCSKKCPATATPQLCPTLAPASPTPQGTPVPRITVVPKATQMSEAPAAITATAASPASPAPTRPTSDTAQTPVSPTVTTNPPPAVTMTASASPTPAPPTASASPPPAVTMTATPPDSPLPTPGSTEPSPTTVTPTPPAEAPSPSPSPEAGITPPPIAGWSFQAVGFYLDRESAILHLSGVAVNTSEQTQQIEDFSLVVYDETEEAIANQGDAYVESPVWLVPPQFKFPFLITVYLPVDSQVGHYELNIESEPTSSNSIPDIDLVDVDWWAEEEDGYKLEGKFKNASELSEFVQIVAMFYDPEGKLVAIGELFDQEKFLYTDAYSFAIDRENLVAAPFGPLAVELEMQIVGR